MLVMSETNIASLFSHNGQDNFVPTAGGVGTDHGPYDTVCS